MRTSSFFLLLFLLGFLASCNNAGKTASLCDTACNTDSLHFKGDGKFNPTVSIGLNACKADTVVWTHDLADSRMLSLHDDIGPNVFLNKLAIDCYIKDTSYAWLQFNDCKTGRGFVYKLPFGRGGEFLKIKGALTKFDPKFFVDPDLVVYTDRGSIFVENIKTSQRAILPFDKQYPDLDFNKLHETVDSIHVTKDRIFVQMLRNGAPVPYEKKISL